MKLTPVAKATGVFACRGRVIRRRFPCRWEAFFGSAPTEVLDKISFVGSLGRWLSGRWAAFSVPLPTEVVDELIPWVASGGVFRPWAAFSVPVGGAFRAVAHGSS